MGRTLGLHLSNHEGPPGGAIGGSTISIRFGYKLESSSEPRNWKSKGKQLENTHPLGVLFLPAPSLGEPDPTMSYAFAGDLACFVL